MPLFKPGEQALFIGGKATGDYEQIVQRVTGHVCTVLGEIAPAKALLVQSLLGAQVDYVIQIGEDKIATSEKCLRKLDGYDPTEEDTKDDLTEKPKEPAELIVR